jgi:signal transduction histidine kinase
MRSAFLAILLPVVLIAVLGGTLLAYRALRPVRKLVNTFHTVIETGDVDTRAPAEDTTGEFAALVHLFNQMLDRIQRLVRGMHESLDHVAHDLRTPMTRLRARAELALKHDDPEKLRAALADLVDTSDAVLNMLDSMMDIAEAEADALSLSMESVPVRDLVRDVADAYQMVAEEKGVALTVDIPKGLSVQVDTGRMRQVLANLLDNAVKYTPPGGRITLKAMSVKATSVDAPTAGAEHVCIAVADTGIGIPAEEQPRIWDRLYRGDRSRSEKGLGLGLSLVHAVVRAHGGHVRVDSTPGKGSVFRIELPTR